MARLPLPGGDANTWGDVLNTYLLVSHTSDGSLSASAVDAAISAGSIDEAQLADDAVSLRTIASSNVAGNNQVLSWNGTSLAWVDPGTPDHGALSGLADDDHLQYALSDGSRGSFATTAQGALADTAVQPADLDARAPDPSGEADGRILEVSSGALVYADAPSGGGTLPDGSLDGDILVWAVPPGGTSIAFSTAGTNGLLNYCRNNTITLSTNSALLAGGATSNVVDGDTATGFDSGYDISNENFENWWEVALPAGFAIAPTKFGIHSQPSADDRLLRDCVIRGSNDQTNWDVLYDSEALPLLVNSWVDVDATGVDPGGYRYFRIYNQGANDGGWWHLILYEFEMWGALLAGASPSWEVQQSAAVQPGDDANTLGSGAAVDGFVLKADGAGGAAWEAESGGSVAALDDLTDVDTSTVAPTPDQALVWDGSNWVPGDMAAGGIALWDYVKSYQVGDRVIWEGQLWEAGFDSSGQTPQVPNFNTDTSANNANFENAKWVVKNAAAAWQHSYPNIQNAGTQTGEPKPWYADDTVWYAFRTVNELTITISTTASSGFIADTELEFYTGPDINNLTVVPKANLGGTYEPGPNPYLASWTNLTLTAGTTYWLQVGSYANRNVQLVLDVTGAGDLVTAPAVWTPVSGYQPTTPVAHAATHANGGSDELDVADLTSGAATNGQIATADGAGNVAWGDAPATGATTLDELTDVDTSTVAPSTDQALVWDGSNWVPGSVASVPGVGVLPSVRYSAEAGAANWTTQPLSVNVVNGDMIVAWAHSNLSDRVLSLSDDAGLTWTEQGQAVVGDLKMALWTAVVAASGTVGLTFTQSAITSGGVAAAVVQDWAALDITFATTNQTATGTPTATSMNVGEHALVLMYAATANGTDGAAPPAEWTEYHRRVYASGRAHSLSSEGYLVAGETGLIEFTSPVDDTRFVGISLVGTVVPGVIASALDDLTDVAAATPSHGDVLGYSAEQVDAGATVDLTPVVITCNNTTWGTPDALKVVDGSTHKVGGIGNWVEFDFGTPMALFSWEMWGHATKYITSLRWEHSPDAVEWTEVVTVTSMTQNVTPTAFPDQVTARRYWRYVLLAGSAEPTNGEVDAVAFLASDVTAGWLPVGLAYPGPDAAGRDAGEIAVTDGADGWTYQPLNPYVPTAKGSSVSTGSVVNLPIEAEEGDFCLIFWSSYSTSSGSAIDDTAPAGFTIVPGGDGAANTMAGSDSSGDIYIRAASGNLSATDISTGSLSVGGISWQSSSCVVYPAGTVIRDSPVNQGVLSLTTAAGSVMAEDGDIAVTSLAMYDGQNIDIPESVTIDAGNVINYTKTGSSNARGHGIGEFGVAAGQVMPSVTWQIGTSTQETASVAILLGVATTEAPIPAGGTSGQVLAKASDDDYDAEWINNSAAPTIPYYFTAEGVLSVSGSAVRFYNPVNVSINLQSLRASVGTPPVGADIIVEILKNGSISMGTATITDAGFTSGHNSISGQTLLADDYITVQINQVGSTTAGSDLTIQLTLGGL